MKYLFGNWKAHKTVSEGQHWISEFAALLKKTETKESIRYILAPGFHALAPLAWMRGELGLKEQLGLAVQDVSAYPDGAYTGEVTARMAADLGATYAIIGHSERRRYFHETNQDCVLKVEQALANGITPVLCVDDEYVQEQAAIMSVELKKACIVAYEDADHIGSGTPSPAGTVTEAVGRIRSLFEPQVVLYGGSITPGHAAEYLLLTDGVLVGGASLEPSSFLALG